MSFLKINKSPQKYLRRERKEEQETETERFGSLGKFNLFYDSIK
jgi:hypothetical protein